MRLKGLVFATVLLLFSSAALTLVGKESEAAERTVSIVIDAEPGLAVRHGLGQLAQALQALGWKVEQIVDPASGSGRFATRIPGQQVKAGTLRYHLEATDTAGKAVRLPQDSGYFSIIVTQDEQPPEVVHQAITQGLPGQPLRITARVQDPSGVRWVRLRYRNVSQFEDYQTLSMEPTGEGDLYAGTLPGEALSPKWDLMYFFEVMDECGNGQICPDLDKETPYIIVRLGSPAEHSEAAN